MKVVDRVFGWLMLLGAFGHAAGSWQFYRGRDNLALLWALSASFAVILLAAINLLRAERSHDRPLAWICFGGCIVWMGFVIVFGVLIGNVFDFRPLINFLITAVLAVFSLRSLRAPR
ncbi:MAG TPA: hypothetical protein VKX25_09080 [Bryobacteraceae bacterium]|jgi:hypothetical protein|nr:hypothetical protein [Bryobacteraceae bacterium]